MPARSVWAGDPGRLIGQRGQREPEAREEHTALKLVPREKVSVSTAERLSLSPSESHPNAAVVFVADGVRG